MDLLSKHIDGLLQTDWQTLVLLAVICGLAAYFIKEYLANPPLIVFVYPVLVLFSLLVQYSLLQLDVFSPRKLDQWLMWGVLASIVGTTLGTGLIACLAIWRDRSGNRGV
jgi:hypothetical protein